MKVELEHQDIEAIAKRVLEFLRPYLNSDGKATEAEVMDVNGLAAYLKVEPSWVYQNHRPMKIPSFRLGNQIRFRKSEVDKWTCAQATEPFQG